MSTFSLTFVRGARRVTGSNFLIEAKEGLPGQGEHVTRILIDCGLTQGERFCDSKNSESFPYDASRINAVFFTHAHADHIGLFPKLVKEGFRGKAYATEATRALMPVMLEDTAPLIVDEARRCMSKPPYGPADVARATALVTGVSYHAPVVVGPVTVTLYNAGHILGSAMVMLEAFGKRVLFTGDLGRTPSILVPEREVPPPPDYLVTESVYGNRVHGSVAESEATLARALARAREKKGVLLIPAFSLERSQIVMSILAESRTPVFMDSPLAEKVTAVYRAYPDFLKVPLAAFPESRDIEGTPPPKVIVAGAGMSSGGRIRAYEKRYLPDPSATILIVGYQVPGSLGRRIADGARKVEIDGEWVTVRATVIKTGGFSAHADRDDLIQFAEAVAPKKAFVVLGETEAASFLAQRISGFLGIETVVPREGERYELI